MTLVRHSSTARAIARHSDSSQPITPARVPMAPRTTHKYRGSLGTENLICRRGVSPMLTSRQAVAAPESFRHPRSAPFRETGLQPPTGPYRLLLRIRLADFEQWRATAPGPTAYRIHHEPH